MAVIDEYRVNGYHIARNLISRKLCDNIVQLAISNADAEHAPLVMPHRGYYGFAAMMRFKPMLRIAEQLIGDKISGLGTEYFFCKPGTRGFLLHQDNMYVQAPKGAFLHAWTALVDVTRENGCMEFYPGSHRNGMYPIAEVMERAGEGQNAGARRLQAVVPSGFTPVDIELKRGDTVFFDSHLVHRSHDNVSQDFRHSWLCTYIKRGAPFNPGTKQKRVEIKL